jgi:hypothetical protein
MRIPFEGGFFGTVCGVFFGILFGYLGEWG